jgi:hypothetical protein
MTKFTTVYRPEFPEPASLEAARRLQARLTAEEQELQLQLVDMRAFKAQKFMAPKEWAQFNQDRADIIERKTDVIHHLTFLKEWIHRRVQDDIPARMETKFQFLRKAMIAIAERENWDETGEYPRWIGEGEDARNFAAAALRDVKNVARPMTAALTGREGEK